MNKRMKTRDGTVSRPGSAVVLPSVRQFFKHVHEISMNSLPYRFGVQRNQDQRKKFGIIHIQTAMGLTEIVKTIENINPNNNNNNSVIYQVLVTCQNLARKAKLFSWLGQHLTSRFAF